MKTIQRLIGAQVAVTLVAAVVAFSLTGDVHAAVSALIGGGIGFTTAGLYAWRAFGTASREPKELLKAQYRAEATKLAATAALFAAAFALYENVSALTLLLTYIATLSVYWLALLFF
jgi:ATP synthase protein I